APRSPALRTRPPRRPALGAPCVPAACGNAPTSSITARTAGSTWTRIGSWSTGAPWPPAWRRRPPRRSASYARSRVNCGVRQALASVAWPGPPATINATRLLAHVACLRKRGTAEGFEDGSDLCLAAKRRANALQRAGKRFGRVGANGGVADLAAGARLLAVIVPMAAGLAQHRSRVRHLPDPVEHARVPDGVRGAQRQAQHCAQVVFEQIGRAHV